ncbi:unnamed protein product, partial [Ixodes hexagonus]
MPRDLSEETLILDVNPLHRIPLVFVNFLIFAASALGAGMAIYSLYYRSGEVSLTGSSILITVAVNLEIPMLAISVVTFLVSFVGFFGALRENRTLLRWYTRLMTYGLILVLCIAAAIVIIPFISKNTLQSLVSAELVEHYRDNADYRKLIDNVQETFGCCGVTDDGYKDWEHNIYFNCSKLNPSVERCFVPSSCCRPLENERDLDAIMKRRFCGRNVLNMTELEAWPRVYQRNCVDAIVTTMRRNIFVVFGITLLILVALLLMRVLAVSVHRELDVLTRIYKKYYKGVSKGIARAKAKRDA